MQAGDFGNYIFLINRKEIRSPSESVEHAFLPLLFCERKCALCENMIIEDVIL